MRYRDPMSHGFRRPGHGLAAIAALVFACAAGAADPARILRVASPDIETLDPQQYADNPSYEVIVAIFEPLYEWDYLASPPRPTPLTAAGPVAVADDGLTWTMRVRPGIYFTDDAAFNGKPRELTAQDYVYSYKRWLDPNGRRGGAPLIAPLIKGARSVIDAARESGKFDFDRPIEGLRALDRYTLQLQLTDANYPVIQDMLGLVGAAAREVVEAAGTGIGARVVGTGPFRLREWKRGSRIVLDANPAYRQVGFPASSDRARAALVRSMQGKRLPLIGGVEISIIDEDVPRLLQFERGGLDYIVLRGEVAARLLKDGKLKPEYAARGVTHHVFAEAYLFAFYFNVADPVIGGMTFDRIALRRAMALAHDIETLVGIVYAGQALPANQIVPPGLAGHDPHRAFTPRYDPLAAKALLDRFGYAKRGADGYRLAPDGKPLVLTMTLRSGALSREIETLWKRNMDAVGLRFEFHVTPFQDAIKELEHGQFQIYFGGFGGSPSGYPELMQLYSKQTQQFNISQFKLAEYDRAAEQFLHSKTEAQRIRAAGVMSELARTYTPLLPAVFRLESNFVQPWVHGFSAPIFATYWKYLDIDLAQRQAATRH
ncbi:MAG: ABC transporter substrate-binding protein [Betaproteobacteria bacterium]